eukprot:TRINITY_DN29192_c0_g1_i1.p1 TRINITY_DN29192_c0_g1~~TRINITY_DN29192_c0_g1_i1.p1  ORF type:complete len:183 (+),score=26.51 TRINITY_DN29192_c0_g1_i1:69-617(+)
MGQTMASSMPCCIARDGHGLEGLDCVPKAKATGSLNQRREDQCRLLKRPPCTPFAKQGSDCDTASLSSSRSDHEMRVTRRAVWTVPMTPSATPRKLMSGTGSGGSTCDTDISDSEFEWSYRVTEAYLLTDDDDAVKALEEANPPRRRQWASTHQHDEPMRWWMTERSVRRSLPPRIGKSLTA